MTSFNLSKFLTFSFFFCSLFAVSQVDSLSIEKRIYTTQLLKKTPVIDGDVTDEAWDVVEWSSDFTQKDPDEGTPPAHQTKFKIIYDAKYLYIALRALDDQPELIQQRLS